MSRSHDVRRLTLTLAVLLALGLPAAAGADEADRLDEAITVLDEIMDAPDAAVPQAILDDAVAIAIFPNTVKAGFIFGGHRRRGFIAARDADTGEWSLPAFLTLTGGSFGLQIGGQAVDLILVVQNRRGLEKLLANEFKIGGDASRWSAPSGGTPRRRPTFSCGRRSSAIRERAASSLESRFRVRRSAPTATPTSASTASGSTRAKSRSRASCRPHQTPPRVSKSRWVASPPTNRQTGRP